MAQKLMKLLDEVAEATWFSAGVCCPSFSNPVCTSEESKHKEVWSPDELEPDDELPPLSPEEPVAVLEEAACVVD